MSDHLLNVGFKFSDDNYEDELIELFGGLMGESGREITWGDRRFLYIYADKDIEFWFPIEADGTLDPTLFGLHYNTHRWDDVNDPVWVTNDESGIGGLLSLFDSSEVFPMNICVPNAFCVTELNENKKYKSQIACFAESVEIYKSEEEFNSKYKSLNKQSFIPIGQFTSEDVNMQSPHGYVCGTVKGLQKKTNSITGNNYYHIVIESYNMDFDILVDEERGNDIELGDIVSVTAFMTGKLRTVYEGSELADKQREKTENKKILTLDDLYCILKKAWCCETAYPKCQFDWDESDPSYGQSDVTAMLVYDMFGGMIHRVSVNGELHYFNRIGDTYVDLTREHFDLCNTPFKNEPNLIFSRKYCGRLEGVNERYEMLKNRISKLLKDRQH